VGWIPSVDGVGEASVAVAMEAVGRAERG